jgi:hypothetical protein
MRERERERERETKREKERERRERKREREEREKEREKEREREREREKLGDQERTIVVSFYGTLKNLLLLLPLLARGQRRMWPSGKKQNMNHK